MDLKVLILNGQRTRLESRRREREQGAYGQLS